MGCLLKSNDTVTEIQLAIKDNSGNLIFTFIKRVEVPFLPEGTSINIAGYEGKCRTYFDVDTIEYHLLVGGDMRFDDDQINILSNHCKQVGWIQVYPAEV